MSLAAHKLTAAEVYRWLERVPDPEIPVLSVIDLGIVRDIRVLPGSVEVSVAPTYSGCPATEVIERTIADELRRKGVMAPTIKRVLSPPWTTAWLTDAGRRKLRAYGIAPPDAAASKRELLGREARVACPRCAATDTFCVSEFGSTPCKASYRCNACLEPFEYFKCLHL